MSSVGLKQGKYPSAESARAVWFKKKKKKKKRKKELQALQGFACNDHTAAISLHQAQRGNTEPIVSIRRTSKQTMCLSRGRFFHQRICWWFSELRVAAVRLLFPASPRHVVWSLDPLSLVGGACSHLGSCLGVTIERALMLRYSRCIQCRYWGGAACCCCKTLPGLVPLLLVMQFCFEEVLGGEKTLFCYFFFAGSSQTEYSVDLKPALSLFPCRTWPMRLSWRSARRSR